MNSHQGDKSERTDGMGTKEKDAGIAGTTHSNASATSIAAVSQPGGPLRAADNKQLIPSEKSQLGE